MLIRGVQGHSIKSIKDDQRLEKISDHNAPLVCVHGTYVKYFRSVQQEGLVAGGLQGPAGCNHVHLAQAISALPHRFEIGILINIKQAMRDGLIFLLE